MKDKNQDNITGKRYLLVITAVFIELLLFSSLFAMIGPATPINAQVGSWQHNHISQITGGVMLDPGSSLNSWTVANHERVVKRVCVMSPFYF